MRGFLQGLAATARGGLAAWLSLLALSLYASRVVPGPGTTLALAGAACILPFACVLGIGTLVALLARMRARGARPAAGAPSAPPHARASSAALARLLALEGVVALACAWLLRGVLVPLVPDRFAYRELIALFLAAHIGVGAGVLAGAAFWRRATGELASFPLWSAIPLHLVARAGTHHAVALFWPANEWYLDFGTALWCVLAGTRWSAAAGARRAQEGTVALAAMIAALACAAVVAALRPGAAAQLVAEFAGPGEAFARVRALYDLDGDGFPGVLGGLDCDDANVRVGPMALEVAGNDIDDNCMGGDLAAVPPAAPAGRSQAAPRRNLILIVVDTLRADALAHGRKPAPMPHTERMAEQGALFRRAYAHAPYTGLALRSLNTGEYPMNMRAFEVSLGMGPTLAERLRAIGYQTYALVQLDEVSLRTGAASADSELLRGFSRVDWSLREMNRSFRAVTSPTVTDRALAELARLRAAPEPFFMWLHYFDPHAEYQPHEGTPFDGSTLSGRYWQEVYATDRELGRLYAELQSSGFFDDGYLVLTGDHGELLGEGGRFQHALWLDEPALRVPLVVRGPAVPAGRHDTRVRHVDLAPTLLDLAAGVRAPLPGRHLGLVWSGRERADRDVVATTTYRRRVIKRAYLRGSHKLFIDVLRGGKSLRRLGPLGEEGPNLIDSQPQLARELEARLGRVWDESINDRVMARRLAAR